MSEFASEFLPVFGNGFDYTTSGTQPHEQGQAPAQPNTLRVYDDPRWQRMKLPNGEYAGDIYGRFEMVLKGFSLQGLNHPEGLFSLNRNGVVDATVITHENNEIFPTVTSVQITAAVPTGAFSGLHSCYAFGKLMLGVGSGANVSLWTENISGASPALTAVTYSPGAVVSTLARVLTAAVEGILVGRIGSAAQILSNATGTVAATMHGDTASCWGACMVGVNSSSTVGAPSIIMLCGTTLQWLSTSVAATTQPTTTKTGLPAGGKMLGVVRPKGREQRVYFLLPQKTTTAGALTNEAEVLFDIWSCDLEAQDLLPLWPIENNGASRSYVPNGVRNAIPYRDGLVYWDDNHIAYWDGDNEYDLNIFAARGRAVTAFTSPITINNSDVKNFIRDACVRGPDLYINWAQAGSAVGNHVFNFERYKFETGSWHPHGLRTAPGQGAAGVVQATVLCGMGGMPLSPDTNYAYSLTCDASSTSPRFIAWPVPKAGDSMLWQNSQGTGSTAIQIPGYSTGSLLSCDWMLDQIQRNPKAILECEVGGNMTWGGAAVWTAGLVIYGLPATGSMTSGGSNRMVGYNETFKEGRPLVDYVKRNTLDLPNIIDLQVALTLTASGTVSTIPRVTPITIRGIYSKDFRPIREEDVGPLLKKREND